MKRRQTGGIRDGHLPKHASPHWEMYFNEYLHSLMPCDLRVRAQELTVPMPEFLEADFQFQVQDSRVAVAPSMMK